MLTSPFASQIVLMIPSRLIPSLYILFDPFVMLQVIPNFDAESMRILTKT